MTRSWIILVLMSCLAVSAQMPEMGDFYYVIFPRQATVGQQVKFEAKEFSGCQKVFTTTYTMEPTPISSKLTFLLRLRSTKGEGCGLTFGYSGPIAIFENLKPGIYKIQFDSLSEFKRDLGDTNSFEVMSSTAISKGRAKAKSTEFSQPKRERTIRIDGKQISKKMK